MWDSVILDYDHNKYTAPLDNEYWNNISILKKTFPLDSFGPLLFERDPQKWILESFETAKIYAYGKLYNDTYITKSYIKECSIEAKRRLVLAGYRLGIIIQEFFGTRGYMNLPADPVYTREIIAWVLDAILLLFIIVYTTIIVVQRRRESYEMSEPMVRDAVAP